MQYIAHPAVLANVLDAMGVPLAADVLLGVRLVVVLLALVLVLVAAVVAAVVQMAALTLVVLLAAQHVTLHVVPNVLAAVYLAQDNWKGVMLCHKELAEANWYL